VNGLPSKEPIVFFDKYKVVTYLSLTGITSRDIDNLLSNKINCVSCVGFCHVKGTDDWINLSKYRGDIYMNNIISVIEC
jgi:hypothetical protein